MLRRVTSRVLVVGASPSFALLFEALGGRGYRFETVADIEAARTYLLRQTADVVLLCLPPDPVAGERALAWLHSVKDEVPVVVLSCEADMQPYLAAMEGGAFDYFTSHTPLLEMERVLANAVRWRRQQVA